MIISSASCSSVSDTVGESKAFSGEEEMSVIPIAEADDTIYISGCLDKVKIYNSSKELYKDSENVFSGTVISSEALFYMNTLQTISCVRVEKVYKGDFIPGECVFVGELGGSTTYGELIEGSKIEPKEFDKDTEAVPLPADKKMEIGYDGYYTMKEGQEVLLFVNVASVDPDEALMNGFPPVSYYVLGVSDGKLLKDDMSKYSRPKKIEPENGLSFTTDTGETMTITVDELSKMKKDS
jgi:hypothetical protein